jgi:hypothetical protein
VVDTSAIPSVRAAITLLPDLEHPRWPNRGHYMPHVVVGDPGQREARISGRTITEYYLGVLVADAVALIDFEVVDANGERCPTDDARVDFTWNSVGRTVSATGPAIWRGGYNSGKTNSTNNLYLNTECGINRVAMRSTLMPGTITLTARREGLQPATLTFDSKPLPMMDGLTKEMPLTLSPAEPGLSVDGK